MRGVIGCRNVLRATIEVPEAGEINFHCTHLDHLDEGWRMKQVDAIIRSGDGPHILAGGLNALDGTDYSAERWADIVKVAVTHIACSVMIMGDSCDGDGCCAHL